LPVIFAAAMPGVGVASYVLAAPLRRNRILMAVALDQGLSLLPFGLYRRMHMEALTTDLANAGNHVPARRTEGWNRALRAAPARLVANLDLIAGVLLLNAVLLGIAIGGTLYKGGTWFGEPGPVAFFSAAQFALAGGLGVLAYVRFWGRGSPAGSLEAARTFFWLLRARASGYPWTSSMFTTWSRTWFPSPSR
jgi:hypothetical protein